MLHKMEISCIFQEDILVEKDSLSELLLYEISTQVQSNKSLKIVLKRKFHKTYNHTLQAKFTLQSSTYV